MCTTPGIATCPPSHPITRPHPTRAEIAQHDYSLCSEPSSLISCTLPSLAAGSHLSSGVNHHDTIAKMVMAPKMTGESRTVQSAPSKDQRTRLNDLQLKEAPVTGKNSGEKRMQARYKFQMKVMNVRGRDHFPRLHGE